MPTRRPRLHTMIGIQDGGLVGKTRPAISGFLFIISFQSYLPFASACLQEDNDHSRVEEDPVVLFNQRRRAWIIREDSPVCLGKQYVGIFGVQNSWRVIDNETGIREIVSSGEGIEVVIEYADHFINVLWVKRVPNCVPG